MIYAYSAMRGGLGTLTEMHTIMFGRPPARADLLGPYADIAEAYSPR